MKVLGLSGSLRAESHNLRLLRAAAEGLPSGGELEDDAARLAEVPALQRGRRGRGARAGARAERRDPPRRTPCSLATPEYNASLPGVLKNALDWVSRPLRGHAAARQAPSPSLGASTGLFGAVWAQAEGRKVLRTIGAHVLEDELPVGIAHEAFDGQGRLRDPELTARLHDVVSSLVRESGTPVEQAA